MARAQQLIFGIHPVLEKLRASPAEVEEVIIAENSARSAARSVDVAARQVGVRVKYGIAAVLDRLATGQRHQGVAAKIAEIPLMQVPRFLEMICSLAPESILVLVGLNGPHNL